MLGRTNTGGGGGGGGLNFKVIPNPIPSTAKENTIWVDTDKINNYYFSAEQPENMVDYDIWFQIGTSSAVAFSATKKNPIMVYPLSAKQYVSGAWVDKTAKSYQGGAWVDWVTYLYKAGNQYDEVTGGWGRVYTGFTLGTINSAGNLYMAGWKKTFATVNPIKKGGYRTICFEVVTVKQNSSPSVNIILSNAVFNGSNPVALVTPSSAGTVRIPLDNVASEFYITLYSYYEAEILEVSEIWLE